MNNHFIKFGDGMSEVDLMVNKWDLWIAVQLTYYLSLNMDKIFTNCQIVFALLLVIVIYYFFLHKSLQLIQLFCCWDTVSNVRVCSLSVLFLLLACCTVCCPPLCCLLLCFQILHFISICSLVHTCVVLCCVFCCVAPLSWRNVLFHYCIWLKLR